MLQLGLRDPGNLKVLPYKKYDDVHEKFDFLENTRFKTLEYLLKTFSFLKQRCQINLYVSVKFKESTQWYKIFYVATAIATAVYSKNMTKNTDYFKHILDVALAKCQRAAIQNKY